MKDNVAHGRKEKEKCDKEIIQINLFTIVKVTIASRSKK